MDGSQFDDLVRAMATTGTRRRVLGGLVAGAFAGLVGRRASVAQGDNAACSEFCRSLPSGPARGECTSAAAQGTGLCYECGPAATDPAAVACQGRSCGQAINACGDTVTCGTLCAIGDPCLTGADCTSGVCGSDSRCLPACSPNCGTGDQCLTGVDCTSDVCGPDSTCCSPTSCAEQGKNCGAIPDGCGGPELECGVCPLAGQPCTDNVCGPCVPNCTGKPCNADNDCDGLCGCPAGQSCAGGGCCTTAGTTATSGAPCCAGLSACSDGVCRADCCGGVSCEVCQTCVDGACVADATQEGDSCNTEGGTCLSNGTCLTLCPSDGGTGPICPFGGCDCRSAINEGTRRYCSSEPSTVQACGSHADCPPGEFCSDFDFRCKTACTG